MNVKLLKIFNSGPKNNKSNLLEEDKQYLVKIYSLWHAGKFNKEWYGWNFDNWGNSGLQLENIDGEIYEIIEWK